MSKNMKRAGVALVSTVALVASAFAGAPALAAGQSDTSFVALTPDSGLSYNVLAVAGRTFTLDANQASSITASGRNLKYLVSDPNEAVQPAVGTGTTTGAGSLVVDDWTVTTNVLQVTDAAHGLIVGDYVYIAGLVETDDETTDVSTTKNPGWRKVTAKTTNTFDADWTNGDVVSAAPGDGLGNFSANTTGTYLKFARATDKSFVVNSGLATNVSDKVLVLENIASTATVSVDVTAWVDDNGDGDIDTTEYASPTRTVSFVGASTVVPTVTWTPVVIGDDKMTASVTLSPTINFDQEPKASFEVDMNRQGSSATIGSDDSSVVAETWTTLTETWSIVGDLDETNRASVVWVGSKTPAVTPVTNASTPAITHYAQAGSTATFTTGALHNLSVNDTVTVSTFLPATTVKITAVTDYTFSYTTSATAATTAKTVIGANAPSVALVAFAFASPGDYKATVKLGGTPAQIGATSIISAGAQIAAGVKNVATVTSNISNTFAIRAAHVAAVQVTSTVTNSLGVAVAAGIPVSIAVTETSTGVVVVNGTTVTTSKTLNTTTDANGQVVITVTNSSGLNGQTVQLAVSSQGFSDTDTLTWATAAYALTDLKDNSTNGLLERSIANGGDLAFNLSLADQWGAAPTGDFRVKIVGAGTRYVFTSYSTMSNGSLNWTLTDSPVDVNDTTGQVTFDVQQKNAAGSWVAPTGTAPLVALKGDGNGELDQDNIVINVRGANGSLVTLNADAVSSADLSVVSTTKVLVAADTRGAGVAANDLSLEASDVTATITGKIGDKFTGVAQPGSFVTLSGSSSILFENGVEAAFGSLTVVADGSGLFSVNAYSNSGLTDSVVTVTANGAVQTVKVTFTGAAADGGTGWVITAPASAAAGTTFQVKAKLLDVYGNGVTISTAGDIKVTYTGPGLIVGDLPKVTDLNGEVNFSVLLGSNDIGSAVITVSYDQNSDDDFLDAKDLTASATIFVGQAAPSATKVNVGTFKGFVALYAKGYEGQKMSAIVAGKWIVVESLASDFERVVRFTGAGYTITTKIYIDGVMIGDAFTTVTK